MRGPRGWMILACLRKTKKTVWSGHSEGQNLVDEIGGGAEDVLTGSQGRAVWRGETLRKASHDAPEASGEMPVMTALAKYATCCTLASYKILFTHCSSFIPHSSSGGRGFR